MPEVANALPATIILVLWKCSGMAAAKTIHTPAITINRKATSAMQSWSGD
jgi:hypothetical protein